MCATTHTVQREQYHNVPEPFGNKYVLPFPRSNQNMYTWYRHGYRLYEVYAL